MKVKISVLPNALQLTTTINRSRVFCKTCPKTNCHPMGQILAVPPVRHKRYSTASNSIRSRSTDICTVRCHSRLVSHRTSFSLSVSFCFCTVLTDAASAYVNGCLPCIFYHGNQACIQRDSSLLLPRSDPGIDHISSDIPHHRNQLNMLYCRRYRCSLRNNLPYTIHE